MAADRLPAEGGTPPNAPFIGLARAKSLGVVSEGWRQVVRDEWQVTRGDPGSRRMEVALSRGPGISEGLARRGGSQDARSGDAGKWPRENGFLVELGSDPTLVEDDEVGLPRSPLAQLWLARLFLVSDLLAPDLALPLL